MDYQENSCQTRKLSLSCVYPTSSTDDKMHLDSVAIVIHDFALENWAILEQDKEFKNQSGKSASSILE